MNIEPKFPFIVVVAATGSTAALPAAMEGAGEIKLAGCIEEVNSCLGVGRPGLLVADYELVKSGSRSELKALKDLLTGKKIPAIFITSSPDEEEEISKTFAPDQIDVMRMPVNPVLLHAKVGLFRKLSISKNMIIQGVQEKQNASLRLQHMVGVIAHDLKSPLSTAVFLLSILKDDAAVKALEGDAGEYISMIYESNIQMADTITLIADYMQESSRQQKTELVNSYEMIQAIIANVTENRHNPFLLEGTFPVFVTNAEKLRRALQMLIEEIVAESHDANKIEIGVVDRTACYEFYLKYDATVKIPEFKKTFLPARHSLVVNNHDSKIRINQFKMLVEEQWGRIWIEAVSANNSTLYFEWKK